MNNQDKEVEVDPFLCHCGPCVTFWRRHFCSTSEQKLKVVPHDRMVDTSIMYAITRKKDHPSVLKIGDRVLVKGVHKGVVKYIGTLNDHMIAPNCFIGVHLDEQVSSVHNGVFQGKRFFHCPRGHGAFVKYCDVSKINPPEKRPPLSGNTMYPNYKDMLERRKNRAHREPTMATWGPPFNRQVIVTVFDKNDIAAKDQEKSDQRKRRPSLQTEEDLTRQDFIKWKQKFGGDDRAEAMANTLRRLKIAHNKGKALECEDAPPVFDGKRRQSLAYRSMYTRRQSTVR